MRQSTLIATISLVCRAAFTRAQTGLAELETLETLPAEVAVVESTGAVTAEETTSINVESIVAEATASSIAESVSLKTYNVI